MPQGGPLAWLEILLLVALAVQGARLIWTLATPVGPLGRWRPELPVPMTAEARAALFARFDPFFRSTSGAGPAAVTSLSLTLYGIRLNEASGQGSAIVAAADGVQSSIAVGEEITPGVRLKAVAIDHIVIDRAGTDETLYIDQSRPAESVGSGVPNGLNGVAAPAPPAAYNAPPAPRGAVPAPGNMPPLQAPPPAAQPVSPPMSVPRQ